jgi:outer membrane protein OmpA-like peptidoglycan-associated protein
MMPARRLAAAALLGVQIAAAGCGVRSASPTAPAPERGSTARDLIVLLPDGDSGATGRASVTNAGGTIELAGANAWTRAGVAVGPTPVRHMSDRDVRAKFGELLGSLPRPAATFTLHFRFDSEDLTAESRGQLGAILAATHERADAEVIIVGHTDRSGPSEANVQLGLKRAQAVRAMLLETRVEARAMRVWSHGEAEPLVATADNVFEPRNRRVEVTVR